MSSIKNFIRIHLIYHSFHVPLEHKSFEKNIII